jgi:hypothetical protein
MEMKTIQDYVKLIEERFALYDGKIGRSDIKWGMWSREMNLEIRKRIEAKDPITTQLHHVFNLWTLYSQLLELRHKYKGKLFGANKIKQKVKEIKRMRAILNEDTNS